MSGRAVRPVSKLPPYGARGDGAPGWALRIVPATTLGGPRSMTTPHARWHRCRRPRSRGLIASSTDALVTTSCRGFRGAASSRNGRRRSEEMGWGGQTAQSAWPRQARDQRFHAVVQVVEDLGGERGLGRIGLP